MISHPETPTVPRESDLSAADKRVSREETDDVRVVDKRWWAQDDQRDAWKDALRKYRSRDAWSLRNSEDRC